MKKWLLAVLLTCASALAYAEVTLTHVHGLAYSPDGKRLMIPSHHGLAVYASGKWSKAPGPEHDYMGFAASATRLYSSGHPAPGSGLVNPFGLIRSGDGGRTWDKLGLEGETDFHVLGVGWKTNAIYVWNPTPSSRMRRAGLHVTLDEGKTWHRAAAAGVRGEPIALAVHPTDPKHVALGTTGGIYESTDGGASFRQLGGGEGTAVFFDLDGEHLWYGWFDGEAHLARARVRGGSTSAMEIPRIGRDSVAYIAQNPAAPDEYAIATFARSVYVSRDAAKSWTPIALRGKGR